MNKLLVAIGTGVVVTVVSSVIVMKLTSPGGIVNPVRTPTPSPSAMISSVDVVSASPCCTYLVKLAIQVCQDCSLFWTIDPATDESDTSQSGVWANAAPNQIPVPIGKPGTHSVQFTIYDASGTVLDSKLSPPVIVMPGTTPVAPAPPTLGNSPVRPPGV
jgi:hypothetical protein